MRRTMVVLSVALFGMVLSYGTALLIVVNAYKKGYGIVGKPEFGFRS